MPSFPLLVAIHVGRPRSLGTPGAENPFDRPWTTSIFKEPVIDPVFVGWTNLEGDGQADLKNHGGPDKAIYVYPSEHYALWRDDLERPDLPYGGFGENFTVEGLLEADVCVGDIFAVGTSKVQVSQPRQPCWKLARRWRIKDLSARVHSTGRTGWYFRVLAEGIVQPGQPLTLLERPCPEWPIARAHDIMAHRRLDRAASADLAACPLLGQNWRETLSKRAVGADTPDASSWLFN